MKKLKYIILMALVFPIVSCDDFLEITPRDVLGIDQVFETENDFFVALNGAYNNIQNERYYGGHFYIIADASSDNGIIPADAETSRVPQFYNMQFSAPVSAIGFWDEAYETLARVNNVLEFLEEKSFSQDVMDRIKGEAFFLRALIHFDLSRVFAQDYNFTTDHSNLGVPIVRKTEIAQPARNTIGEVYGFVLEELTEAITLLEDNDRPQALPVQFIASREAALGVRARVYLYMGEDALARDDANAVIASGFDLTDYIVRDDAGAVDLSQIANWSSRAPTSESIFEVEVDERDDEYPGLDGLAGYYQKDAGSAVFGPNLDIINLYAADDVRRNWYQQDNGIWHVNKYPGQGGLPLQFTTPIVRLTEMYLIKAETCARLNDEDGARTAINLIRGRANQPDINSTGNQLLNDILEERRRELAFEGHRFFDLKRLQQDIVRNDCSLTVNCVVPYGDKLMAYPIPQEEIDGNSNIVQEGY
ncbi:MAG: RagB/SusD family nutrient uptake outer membrane protein [Cyclobacteriaceae bacterium]|nr:RagB/SusD family nutrient uptake outer membrane protein [Cyclobacteriaceae bacterium HetDA_MAG_MS6]